jgi:hypothetical protein
VTGLQPHKRPTLTSAGRGASTGEGASPWQKAPTHGPPDLLACLLAALPKPLPSPFEKASPSCNLTANPLSPAALHKVRTPNSPKIITKLPNLRELCEHYGLRENYSLVSSHALGRADREVHWITHTAVPPSARH